MSEPMWVALALVGLIGERGVLLNFVRGRIRHADEVCRTWMLPWRPLILSWNIHLFVLGIDISPLNLTVCTWDENSWVRFERANMYRWSGLYIFLPSSASSLSNIPIIYLIAFNLPFHPSSPPIETKQPAALRFWNTKSNIEVWVTPQSPFHGMSNTLKIKPHEELGVTLSSKPTTCSDPPPIAT